MAPWRLRERMCTAQPSLAELGAPPVSTAAPTRSPVALVFAPPQRKGVSHSRRRRNAATATDARHGEGARADPRRSTGRCARGVPPRPSAPRDPADQLLAETQATAARLATRNPLALAQLKRAIYFGAAEPLSRGLDQERARFLGGSPRPRRGPTVCGTRLRGRNKPVRRIANRPVTVR